MRSKYATVTRFPMLPKDTNDMNDIFGGVILSHIDRAGFYAVCSISTPRRVVTVAMKEVEFKKPVHVGDMLSCRVKALRIGNSSATVRVVAEAERGDRIIRVTEAEVTYVAVTNDGRSTSIRPGKRARNKAIQPVRLEAVPGEPIKQRICCAATRFPMEPGDLNQMGRIFGGVILSHIDLAGREGARRVCSNPRLVTVCIKEVMFKKPVLVGDMLICWAEVQRIGTTSVTVKVEVEVEREGDIIPVTEAVVTYVAIDGNRQPEAVVPYERHRKDRF